jgi:hypothetical protein
MVRAGGDKQDYRKTTPCIFTAHRTLITATQEAEIRRIMV